MFFRPRRKIPELNTTSTADISFMLLIFFLVTSSMDTDKGLPRQLPPAPDETQQQEVEVKKRNVMSIRLDADNRLTCNDEAVDAKQLTKRVAEFVSNPADDPLLPEKSMRELHLVGRHWVSDRHVLSVQVNRHSDYAAYFALQHAIVEAYGQLRNQMSMELFGHRYAECVPDERDVIMLIYPQRISEEQPAEEGEMP